MLQLYNDTMTCAICHKQREVSTGHRSHAQHRPGAKQYNGYTTTHRLILLIAMFVKHPYVLTSIYLCHQAYAVSSGDHTLVSRFIYRYTFTEASLYLMPISAGAIQFKLTLSANEICPTLGSRSTESQYLRKTI